MRSSTIFPLMTSILLASLPVSLFVLPTGYSYDETCPICQGVGTVTCETCHGSGACWICDGTGRIWYMPNDGWCAACQGSGNCYTCGGKGWHTCGECEGSGLLVHWMYNLIGATGVASLISILLFLGIFIFAYAVSAFYLDFNPWIYEVKNMEFWFNPSFMTWLFAKHRSRWVKWQTAPSLIVGIYLGVLIFWVMAVEQITQETLSFAMLLSIAVVSLFSWVFYKSCISRLTGI